MKFETKNTLKIEAFIHILKLWIKHDQWNLFGTTVDSSQRSQRSHWTIKPIVFIHLLQCYLFVLLKESKISVALHWTIQLLFIHSFLWYFTSWFIFMPAIKSITMFSQLWRWWKILQGTLPCLLIQVGHKEQTLGSYWPKSVHWMNVQIHVNFIGQTLRCSFTTGGRILEVTAWVDLTVHSKALATSSKSIMFISIMFLPPIQDGCLTAAIQLLVLVCKY